VTRPPTLSEIRVRARRIAEKGILTEEEALELLATATGVSDGCCELVDGRGRPLPTPHQSIFDLGRRRAQG